MTAGIDIISGALRLISSATPGEAINGQEASNALVVLNELMSSFSMEWGLINIPTLESFPLVVGQTSYTIGTGGNFNTVRPDSVFNQWLYDTAAGIRYPLKQIADNQYNAIPLNTIASIPKVIFYDPQYPLGIIYIYPVASLATYQLNIESYKPMAQFTTLNTVMNLPGEYFKCLKLLLANELAPEYGFPIGQDMKEEINKARDMMKARNFRRVVASFDAALMGDTRGGTILDGFIN